MGFPRYVVAVPRLLAAGRRSSEHRVLIAVTIVALIGAAGIWLSTSFATAAGCTDSWTSASTGSWDTPSNWSTGKVPMSSDRVCISASGNTPYSVIVGNETIEVASLTVGGTGSEPTLMIGNSSAGGTPEVDISGDIDIVSTGTVTVAAPTPFAASLTAGSVTNAGALSVQNNATLTLSGGSTFENTSTGTITVGSSDTFDVSSPSGQTAAVELDSGGVVHNSGSLTVSDTLEVDGGSICGNALHFGNGHGAGALAFAPVPGTGPACGVGVASDEISLLDATTLSGTIPASYTVLAGGSGIAYEVALSGDVVNDGTFEPGVGDDAGTLSAADSSDYLTNNGTVATQAGGTFDASVINNGAFNIEGAQNNVPITASLQNGSSWQNTSAGTITVGSGDSLMISSPSGQTAAVEIASGGAIDNSGSFRVADTLVVNGGSICGNALVVGSGDEGTGGELAFAATPGSGPACGSGVATDHIHVLNVPVTLSGTIPASYTLDAGDTGGGAFEVALSGDVVNDGTFEPGFDDDAGTVSGAGSSDYLTNNGTVTTQAGGTFDASLINNSAFNIEGEQNNVPITASLQNGRSWQNTSAGTITVGASDRLDISSPSGQSASFNQDGVIENSGTFNVADPITINGGTICQDPLKLGSGDETTGTFTLTFAANPSAGPACGSGQKTDQLFIYNVAATLESDIPAGYTVASGDAGSGEASLTTPGDLTNAGTLEPQWGSTLTLNGSNGTLTNTGTIEVPPTGFTTDIDASAVDNTSGNVEIGDSSTLAISGTYSQGAQGTFTPQIDGTSAGSTYGQMTAAGGSTLAGTLDIDTLSGFSPTTGNTFKIIKGGTVSGTFATILGQYPAGDNSAYGVSYDASDVTLTVSGQSTTSLTVGDTGDGSGTVSSAPAGIDCGSTCVAGFPQNQNVTLTETPASGSVFTGWSGDCSGTSTTCQVTLSTARSVQASFIVPPNTTTSLQSSVEPSTVGEQVTYTATVSPTPDGGTVSFTDGGSTISGCGSAGVNTSTGVATCASTYSAVGSHTIQASYSGETDFGGSQSSSQVQVVDAANTATVLQSSANPSLVAQQVTYTASVSPVPDGGTVSFTDGGSTISGCGSVTVNISSGEATCQATYGATGSRTIQATYAGDTNFGGSQTGPFEQVVDTSGTSTSLQSSANPSLPEQQVIYTATVSPKPDGGTVAFTDGGATITGCESVAVDTSTGEATCQATYVSTGSPPIEANYSGDTLYGASAGNLTQVVAATGTATALQSSENPSLPGRQVTFTATVSPVPDGGTVAFTDGVTTITGCESVAVNTTTGVASCQVTYPASGSHSIEADYSGDTLFGTSHGTLTQVISSTSTALQSSANPSLPEQQVTYTATVSPVPDGGTVAFTDGGSTITGCGSVAVNTSTGEATCEQAYTSTGSHQIQAVYSGDANFAGSGSTTLTQTVSTTSTTTALQSSPNPSLPEQQVTYTATVSPIPDGGTVAFTDGVTTISGCESVAVNTTTGVASCQVTYPASGSHSIEADYSGDTLFGTSHGTLTQVISSTSTALASSANPSAPGQQVTYTATISPTPDGGTVAFTDGGSTITGCGSASVDPGTGKATCQTSYPATGTHPIQAVYSGDQSFAGSESTTLTQTVSTTSTATALQSSANPSTPGQQVTYTATVSPTPDGGTVTFADGGTTISGCESVALNTSTGEASCQATYASDGSHSIEADYSGDTLYGTSDETLTQLVKSLTPTTTTLQSSFKPSFVSSYTPATAKVSPVPDGGTVNFNVNGSPSSGCASVPINTSTGEASCTYVLYEPMAGELGNTTQASYSGDATFASSQSATLAVPALTTTTLRSSGSAAIGQQLTLTATVSRAPDGGTVSFTNSGSTISGCGTVVASTSTGVAVCHMSITTGGLVEIVASYSGDADYLPSGSHVPIVALVPFPPIIERVSSTGSSLTTTVSCAGSCSGTVTITVTPPARGSAPLPPVLPGSFIGSSASKKKRARTKTITLGTAHFAIQGKGSESLTIRLTKAGRKFLSAHHGRSKAKLAITEKTTTGTVRTTHTINITPAKKKPKK